MKSGFAIAIIFCCAGILSADSAEMKAKDINNGLENVSSFPQGNQSQTTEETLNRIDKIVNNADRSSKKEEAIRKYKEAFLCYEKEFAKKLDPKLFLKHHPKMLHCADRIIRYKPRETAAFEHRIRVVCRKHLIGKKVTEKVFLKNNQLLFEIGLDHDLKLTLKQGKLHADKGGGFAGIYSHGGVGTHHEIPRVCPDLFFGYPACVADNQIWELNNPLNLFPVVTKIKEVKLLFCGRKHVAINAKGVCSIRWDKNNIWLSDHASGPQRYKILVIFQ